MGAFHDYQEQAANYLHRLRQHRKIKKSTNIHLGEKGLGYRILHHRLFELSFGAIILCNLFVVIVETDAVALGDQSPAWVNVVSWIILCSFVFEIALRLSVLRCSFWYDACNAFDFALVALDLMMTVLDIIAGSTFPVSFLRIVRLSKLGRLAKAFHVFPELQLMMGGLVGALEAIMWGTMLLVFFVVTWSIVAVQFIHPLNEEIAKTNAYENCDRCSRAYSTVFQAALTICQQVIAGDSWGLVSITVIEHYPASAIFFALVFLSVGLTILNLILGVVVDVACQERERMKSEHAAEKVLARQESESHLLEECAVLDVDKSGTISWEELLKGYEENERFRGALEVMEICEEDLEVLWSLLDMEGTGSVRYADLVTKFYNLKTSDTQFMLAYVKHYVTVIKKQICAEMEMVVSLGSRSVASRVEVNPDTPRISFRKVVVDPGSPLAPSHVNEDKAQSSVRDVNVEKSCDEQDTAELLGVVKELVAQFNEEIMACIDGKKAGRRVANGVAKLGEQGADKLDEHAGTKASGLESKKDIGKDVCQSLGDLAPCHHQALLNFLESSHTQQVESNASMKAIQEQLDMLVSCTLRTSTVSTTMTMPHLLDTSQSIPSAACVRPRDQTLNPWAPFPDCFGGSKVKVLALPPPHVPAPLSAM